MGQQRAPCPQRPHDGVFAFACLAAGAHGSQQHHQASGQGEGKQILHRTDDLVHDPLHLGQGAAHVDTGDVRKLVDQGVLKSGLPCRRPERGHVGHGQIRHLRNREHHEEVGAHGGPVHLAQTGDAGLPGLACDVKAQLVTQLEPQRIGNALFDAHAIGLFSQPAARCQRIVLGQDGRMRQVDFAVNQAFGTVGLEVGGTDFAAIDGHQATPDHGKPVGRLHTGFFQLPQKVCGLLGLYVDDKPVGCVGRRGLAPAGNQVSAQQNQQGQRQQTHRQGTDLDHGKHGPSGHLARGQPQPTRGLLARNGAPEQPQSRGSQTGKHQQGQRKAPHGDQAQSQVAADHQQGQGKAHQTHEQHQARTNLQVTEVTPNHAQWWHLSQLQHRRQAKSHQQCEPHGHAHQGGLCGGGRQLRIDQTRQ